jgi:hypothetical protein
MTAKARIGLGDLRAGVGVGAAREEDALGAKALTAGGRLG